MTEQIPIETLHPTMRLLSNEQIEAIHHTSLDILSQTGIVMKNALARQLLLDTGAWESEDPIKIPPHLLMYAKVNHIDFFPDDLRARLGALGEFVEHDDEPSRDDALERLISTDVAIAEWITEVDRSSFWWGQIGLSLVRVWRGLRTKPPTGCSTPYTKT